MSWPENAPDPEKIRFHDIFVNPADVWFYDDGYPETCHPDGARRHDFVCQVGDAEREANRWVGVFELDVHKHLTQPVTVTMKVSVEPADSATTGEGSTCVSGRQNAC